MPFDSHCLFGVLCFANTRPTRLYLNIIFVANKFLFVQNAARFTLKDKNKHFSPSSDVLDIADVFYKITIGQIFCSFERLYPSLEGKHFTVCICD